MVYWSLLFTVVPPERLASGPAEGVPPGRTRRFWAVDGGDEWWRVKTLVTTLKPTPRLAYKEKWWRVVASFFIGCVGVL